MAELDKSLESLASVQEKLARGNAAAASKAEAAAAKQLEKNQAMEKRLEALIASAKAGNRTNEKAEKQLADLQLDMRITADKAEATAKWQQSSAGQAVALQRELESLGHKAEDNKKFSRLTYKAAQADLDARLAAPGLSKSARKEIKEEKRNLAKRDGNRLEKIAAGIGGLFGLAKKGAKAAALGGMALLSTLAIGGLLIALGKFLQSDTFKKITAYIFDTLIPKLKEFYNAFFGEGGGLIKGFSKLFDDKSGVGAIVAGIAGVTLLFGAAKLAKIFGPLKGAVGKLLSGLGGLASKIPGIKKIPGIPGGGKAGAASSVATKAGRAGGGGGLGKSIASMGKGIGKGLGGLLQGVAAGLKAMANPMTLLGLAAVVLAINGIALAIRIMSPAFEPIGKMFISFGKTIREVFGGLGDFIKAIGKTIEGIIGSIGKAIGNVIDKITSMKTAGTEATTKQIKELSAIPGGLMLETAKGIDAIKKALDGFGGGTFSQIAGSLFGGKGPIDKIIKLSEKVPALMKASEAIAVLGAAGQDFAKAEAELERRKKVAKLKKKIAGGYDYRAESRGAADQAELAALEGQAMAISPAGGGGGFGPQTKNMITAAINAADLTLIEKERMKREAEFKTAGLTTTGQQVFNQDNRQQNTNNNMGATGRVGVKPAKLNNVNKGNATG
jgi:hypothetical protein